jgi:hypothetical protein
MQISPAAREITQEGVRPSPVVTFLKDVLGALIFLAAASGTAVFLLL